MAKCRGYQYLLLDMSYMREYPLVTRLFMPSVGRIPCLHGGSRLFGGGINQTALMLRPGHFHTLVASIPTWQQPKSVFMLLTNDDSLLLLTLSHCVTF